MTSRHTIRAGLAALILSFVATAASAQSVPRNFPLDRAYSTISISGFDVQRSGMTLTVRKEANGVVGAGSAGCNTWRAAFLFREDEQFDVGEIITTRKMCPKPRMTSEQAFLTTLRSAHRWRVEGNRLILEGEAGRLLLTAASPAKKSPKS